MAVSCFTQNKSEGRVEKQKGKGGQILCYVQSTMRKEAQEKLKLDFHFMTLLKVEEKEKQT